MKIVDLKTAVSEGRKRVSAWVHWEESERPPMELYFETDTAIAGALDCNPDAFATACILPALRHGERRLAIDAALSPELINGLMDVQGWMRHWWYPLEKPPVKIESVKAATIGRNQQNQPRCGMFFSGGVDSLASLRANRLTYANDHPYSVKDGFIVFGLETDQEEKFTHVLASLSPMAEDADLQLIPVYSNIRYLDDDWMFWERQFEDAVFAAIAHTFRQRLTVMNIASTYDIPNMQKCGTHPVLDIAYSTHDLRILHDTITLNRMDKIRLLAGWQSALDHMRVCNRSETYDQQQVNCGVCWKCVKTRLALMSIGVDDRAGAFPDTEITPELVASVADIYITTACWWEELIEPLRAAGLGHLARIIDKKIDRYRLGRIRLDLKSIAGQVVKRYDQKYLKGRIRGLNKRLKARNQHHRR